MRKRPDAMTIENQGRRERLDSKVMSLSFNVLRISWLIGRDARATQGFLQAHLDETDSSLIETVSSRRLDGDVPELDSVLTDQVNMSVN